MVTVRAGTNLLVRVLDTIDSSKAQPGTRFTGVLETNLSVDGWRIAPAGNTVYGRLAEAKQAGRVAGSSNLQLELTDIVVDGTPYPIITSDFEVKRQQRQAKRQAPPRRSGPRGNHGRYSRKCRDGSSHRGSRQAPWGL